ncbi:MAG: hypothetical protein AAGC67_06445 [Myxococcota bacterium]
MHPRLDPRPNFSVLLFLLLTSAIGCLDGSGGGGGSEPEALLPASTTGVLPAVSGGILLPGAPTAQALDETRWMRSTPAEPGAIDGDGTLLDRLVAVLDPAATVEGVNAVLVANGATVLAMSGGSPILVLRVPTASNLAALVAFAETLEASAVFLDVAVSRTPAVPPPPPTALPLLAVPIPANGETFFASHWPLLRLPAAWNVFGGVEPGRVKLFSASEWGSRTLGPDLDPEIRLLPQDPSEPFAVVEGANDGHYSMGLIAGDLQGAAPGVLPPDTADVYGFSFVGLGFFETMNEFAIRAQELAAQSDGSVAPLVLHFDARYEDDAPMIARVLDALAWRLILAQTPVLASGSFIAITPAGPEVEAGSGGVQTLGAETSPWALSKNFGDLGAFADENGDITDAEAAQFRSYWDALVQANPQLGQTTRALVVEGSDALGVPLVPGAQEFDLLAPGEDVASACLFDCTETDRLFATGPEAAAALVAGIAAYVWALDPEQSVSEVIAATNNRANPWTGQIDAYTAVLRVDDAVAPGESPARSALLDVASGMGVLEPNGIFDEADVDAFLAFFADFASSPFLPGGGLDDYSRFDLNGNGFTGDAVGDDERAAAQPFDLDADRSLGTASVQIDDVFQEFDETALTDLGILCFYAHGPLFAGNPVARDDLLGDACLLRVEIDFASVVEAGELESALVRVLAFSAEADDFVPVEGAEVRITTVNATTAPDDGLTDADGFVEFSVTATGAGAVEIEVEAAAPDQRFATARTTASLDTGSIGTPTRTFEPRAILELEFGDQQVEIEEFGTLVLQESAGDIQYRVEAEVTEERLAVELDVSSRFARDWDAGATLTVNHDGLPPGTVLAPAGVLSGSVSASGGWLGRVGATLLTFVTGQENASCVASGRFRQDPDGSLEWEPDVDDPNPCGFDVEGSGGPLGPATLVATEGFGRTVAVLSVGARGGFVESEDDPTPNLRARWEFSLTGM